MDNLTIPYPPKEIFAERSAPEAILNEGNVTHLLDHIEYPESGGIRIYIQKAKYPKKGFPFPEAIWAINIAKRNFIELIRILTFPELSGSILALLLPYKRKVKLIDKLLQVYSRMTIGVLHPFVLQTRFLTPAAIEVDRLVYHFLRNIGINDNTSEEIGIILHSVIEYDDAYRFRLEDIMSETTKEKLMANPRKEIKRLTKMMAEREHDDKTRIKVRNLSKVFSLLLLSGKIKKAFIQSVSRSTFPNIQLDDADRYWVSMRNDYDYFGTRFEDRDVTLLMGYKINI